MSKGKLEAHNKDFIDTSIQTLERSAKLIDNVRKLQKLSAGEYKPEIIDLGKLLANVIKENASDPGVDVTMDYDPAYHYNVKANTC